MYIKKLTIKNFRGIKEGDFAFKSGMNILIGPINSGKSTVLKAVDLVLDPNIAWWRRDVLDELDFYMRDTNNPIVIDMILGCGRPNCTSEDGTCSRFEIVSEGDAETCKLQNLIVFVNGNGGITKADSIKATTKLEACLHVRMQGVYQKEGYVDVTHNILKEDEEETYKFTRPMKKWVGIVMLDAGRNPDSECRLQYNSLLSRCVGDTGEWQRDFMDGFRGNLKGEIDKFISKEASNLLQVLQKKMAPVKPIMRGDATITLEGANKRDLLRQVELCVKREALELPVSRHGRGTQNIFSLMLATISEKTPKEINPDASIIMIEEPEQNLEPHMQRSMVSFIKSSFLSPENEEKRQCIITTHSPFVLLSSLDLMDVFRICHYDKDKAHCINLGEIKDKTFPKIRNSVCFESELFESLFSTLVIIWEGQSEAGMYQAILRAQNDFPAELLTGLVAGGARNLLNVSKWFHDGGYSPLVVCDGDRESQKAMSELKESNFAFIALPAGKGLEDCIADHLTTIQPNVAIVMLLNVMGAAGTIYKGGQDAESIKKWPALDAVFTQENKSSLDTNLVISKMSEASPPTRETVVAILSNHKERYKHRILGEQLSNSGKLGVFEQVINKLKDIWVDRSKLGCFQVQNDGTLAPYS